MATPPDFLPIPVFPALVLQPIPVLNPVLPQTNWNTLFATMQTVATKTANIPNLNPIQQIVAMNANMNTLVRGFNQLQGQLIQGYYVIVGALPGIINMLNLSGVSTPLDLMPMHAHNATVPASGHIQYPPNIVVVVPLLATVGDAMLTGPQYFAAIDALMTANAPDLMVIANNVPSPQMQNHFLSYLGILL
ncbi:hypothetical protein B0H14DRAFT_2628271 [Mycena olivaceomarginata]|nr:hypothetical protein B0H14DRAFT_2628271 [Mycena olivaceomarginata]